MRTRLFLTLSLSIGLVVLCTVLVFKQFQKVDDQNPTLNGATSEDGTGTNGVISTVPEDEIPTVPGEGQVQIFGTVRSIHLEGAVLAPRTVPTPLTIGADRGFGNGGEITGVEVDGQAASIVWDGGRPFELIGGDGLILDPVTVDLIPDGLQLGLGGASHALRPGTYELDTPVAVGTVGIATPRDSVTFTTGDDALFEGRGDASMLLGPDAPHYRFRGPGLVELEGSLAITGPNGLRETRSFDLSDGYYDLTFTPTDDGGWSVTGIADR